MLYCGKVLPTVVLVIHSGDARIFGTRTVLLWFWPPVTKYMGQLDTTALSVTGGELAASTMVGPETV